MPKHPMKSQHVAAMLGHPPTPGLFRQQQDVHPLARMGILTEDAIRNFLAQHDAPTLMQMGILTEDEIRNPAFYTEHYRCKNQAMERDLMQIQAACHDLKRVHHQNQEAMRKIAYEQGRLAQLLSRPEVQHHKDFKHLAEFLPHCQRVHKMAAEAAAHPFPSVPKLNSEVLGLVEVMDPKDLQTPVQVQQANGTPVDPNIMSQSRRRKRHNRRRQAGKNITPTQAS